MIGRIILGALVIYVLASAVWLFWEFKHAPLRNDWD